MTATLNIPTQRQGEHTGPDGVAWDVTFLPGTSEIVVSLWRTDGVAHLVPLLRAGQARQCTVREDCTLDEVVAAVGMSGQTVTAADPASMVRAALTGFDLAGSRQVRAVVAATRAVLAGEPLIHPERERHAAVWPTLAAYQHCRATVAALVDDRTTERVGVA